jgi:hypothetical protein
MAALVWVMMGIALWHFAIFVPDHFWSGIVGAFVGAVMGALVFGFLLHGLTVPGQNDTDLINALEAIPGAVAGMAVVYFIGRRDAAPRGVRGVNGMRSSSPGWTTIAVPAGTSCHKPGRSPSGSETTARASSENR